MTRRPFARSTGPPVGCVRSVRADGGTFEAVITDISLVGMFIKTERALPPAKAVRISCRLPGAATPLILDGHVQRSEPTGIGLRLKALTPDQERAIRAFIKDR